MFPSPASSMCGRNANVPTASSCGSIRSKGAGSTMRRTAFGSPSAKGTAPPVGSYVELKARLNTPLAPLRPGGYDFARDLYFQGIGAVGFVLGSIKIAD